jgi:hypothetical protein
MAQEQGILYRPENAASLRFCLDHQAGYDETDMVHSRNAPTTKKQQQSASAAVKKKAQSVGNKTCRRNIGANIVSHESDRGRIALGKIPLCDLAH